MIGYHEGMVNGSPETVFHLKDYYIARDSRGKGLGYRTTEKLFRETHNRSVVGYAVIMLGNRDPHRYIGRRNPTYPYIPYSRILNQLDVRNILLTWPMAPSGDYTIRNAGVTDIPAMVSLLNNEHKGRLFGNVYRQETFQQNLDKSPGLTLKDYYLAFDKSGTMVGVCAAWDCSSFKQTRVLQYGRPFLPARIAYKAMELLFRLPPLPIPGNYFKEFMITDYAVRDRSPNIMNAMLRTIYKDYRKRGFQNMIWGSSADDPLLEATKGFFYKRLVSNIVLITTEEGLLETGAIQNNIPYIDLPGL
jgi:hypothetical protein